jgi:hypothetical protein
MPRKAKPETFARIKGSSDLYKILDLYTPDEHSFAVLEDYLGNKNTETYWENLELIPFTKENFSEFFAFAKLRGMERGNAKKPKPMIVQDTYRIKQYFVPSGVCGFAWVIVKPGNCAFANFLKKENFAHKDSYNGGVNIWIHEHGQSFEQKSAHAQELAFVLRFFGIQAYSGSRLD